MLHEAMQLAPDERSKLLNSIEPGLRPEIESLLEAHDKAGASFLTPTTPQSLFGKTVAVIEDARIGNYRIIERIGEGGMGEVFRAVRDDDQYSKEVAIKLVRSEQNSSFVLGRFRNERQILASLDHPNIARLLDGGTTQDGRPFFAMEFIAGEPIDEYCDSHHLSITERLKLFLQVCSAVQFAHQRLVIHRDIKPANILVNSDGTPKLLDFGIAKILDVDSANQPDRTLTMFRVMTPEYASPEQVKGEPITTATDVYSLGIVLYELLTGLHPYRGQNSTASEIARATSEIEPEKPSTAVRKTVVAIAQKPSANGAPQELSIKRAKHLRGDLDNIVLMALRKESQRRYGSVDQFSEDIRRHLENLPIAARKDTARYRISKFVIRNKAGVAATTAVALILIVALIVTLQEARIARRRFNDVRALANSLIFDVHDSIKDLPGSTPARKLIVDRALQYLNSLAQESSGDLGLQRELATAYERVALVQGHYIQDNLGDTKGSLESYQKALGIREQINAKTADWKDRLALAQAYRHTAEVQRALGYSQNCEANIKRATAISEKLNTTYPDNVDILREMSSDYSSENTLDADRKAQAADEAALRMRPDDLSILGNYSADLGRIGSRLEPTDPQAALSYYQKQSEISKNLTQKSNAVRYRRELALSYRAIGSVYTDLQDYPHSLEYTTKYLNIMQEIYRADPQNVTLRQSLAIAYANAALDNANVGNIKIALDYSAKAVEIMRKLVLLAPENKGQRHYFAATVEADGTVLMFAREPKAAFDKFQEARGIYQSLGSSYGGVFDAASASACREKMAEAAASSGETEKASDYFHQALVEVEPLLSAQPPTLMALYIAADAYSGLGDLSANRARKKGQTAARQKADWTEARSWYAKSLDAWHRIEHPIHSIPGTALNVGDQVSVRQKLQQCEEALANHASHSSP